MRRLPIATCLGLCFTWIPLLAVQQSRAPKPPLYSDENLLPQTTSQLSPTMLLPVFVRTRDGAAPRAFTSRDFVLLVGGRIAKAKVMRPWDEEGKSRKDAEVTQLLLVLPPNQPLLHNMATEDAIRYFSKQRADGHGRLPWDVSLFDSNGRQTEFTRKKAVLLAELESVRKTIEPLESNTDRGGNWLDDARHAIYRMQVLSGRRIVVAFNPQPDPGYGLLEFSLMQTDPSGLVGAAERAGAQLYIANSTGPEMWPTAFASWFGTQISNMSQTSQLTGAGYANSLKDLFVQIIAERDMSYVLKFKLNPQELDHTSLAIRLNITNRNLTGVALQPFPAPSSLPVAETSMHERVPRSMKNALNQRISSSELQIAQHVDYFPVRKGTRAILPFSCALIWTGQEAAPHRLKVVERVEQADSGFVALARQLTLSWNGRFASWERDDHLLPGKYKWKVAVADGDGKVIASSILETRVPLPSDAPVQLSTIVTGVNCRHFVQDNTQSMASLRGRSVNPKITSEGPADVGMDPMLENACLLEPNPTIFYSKQDTLRALVRVYLTDKVDKGGLDIWKTKFDLINEAGQIEVEQRTTLSVDSAPGYLAAIQLPLGGKAITTGLHFLRFELRGPHVKQPLIRSTGIMIR